MKRAVFFCIAIAVAQGQSSPPPAFEVASVKIAANDFVPGVTGQMKGGPGTSDPGRIAYTQVRLQYLLTKAWNLSPDQVTGPGWLTDPIGRDSFTINATMPPDTTPANFRLMLQNLLIERFRIRLHHETRNFPGYELVVAPGGPKLKETTQDPAIPAQTRSPIQRRPDGSIAVVMPERKPDGSIVLLPGPQAAISFGGGTLRAQYQAQPVSRLAEDLGAQINRVLGLAMGSPVPRVVDKTGLTGKYDFTLECDCPACTGLAGLNLPLMAGRGGAEPGPNSAPSVASDPGSGLPNIFNAMDKQLGLKLVKVKDIPLDILVIDQLEKVPTEN